jgi:hypothetical protein
VKFWWVILAVLAVVAIGCVAWCVVTRRDVEAERVRRQHAALAARADEQHAWILAGDDRGVYGQYPPVAM